MMAASTKVHVINLGRADFSVTYDEKHDVFTVLIKPRIRCDSVEFSDGSIGTEWGPEDGSNIQRRVEAPKGGWSAQLTVPQEEWGNCEAGAWVRSGSVTLSWTMVHQPVSHYPGAWPVGYDVFPEDWPVARVKLVLGHE